MESSDGSIRVIRHETMEAYLSHDGGPEPSIETSDALLRQYYSCGCKR